MQMQRMIACLVLVVAYAEASAAHLSSKIPYYPNQFYIDVERGVTGQPLKQELFEILSRYHMPKEGAHDTVQPNCGGSGECYRHISLGYNAARRILFGELHLISGPNGYSIRDVYCQQTVTRKDFRGQPPGPGQIPDPTVLNAEHTWPQSRFTSRYDKGMQKSDLHILYPVISHANSSRGNDEFGDVVTKVSSPCAPSERGYISTGTNKIYFEVPDDHKGNVARAIFYFSTRYGTKIAIDEENSLRTWHRNDPPDAHELQRNEGIFAKQKVRNPFIDHPELVELISDF